MPAIDRVIGNRIVYNQTELKYVLQQLHQHRQETWKISQDSVKTKNDKKRKGTNSRRSDVSNLIVKIYHITIILFHFKRKRKGENEVLHICIIPMMIQLSPSIVIPDIVTSLPISTFALAQITNKLIKKTSLWSHHIVFL